MKTSFRLLAAPAFAALVALVGCDKKPTASSSVAAANPESAKTFDATAAHLDAGGDLYVYLRTEQLLATVPTAMDEWKASLVTAAGKDLPLPPEQVDAWYAVARKAVVDTGITQLRAFGMSSVELEPGLSRIKSVLYTGDVVRDGLLWKLGGRDTPHAIAALDFLPATTAYAAFSDFDPAALQTYIQQIVAAIPDPALKAQAESLPAMAAGVLGMPLPDLLASLGTEMGFVITADGTRTMTVPGENGKTLTLPEAAAAFLIEVKDDKMYDLIVTKLETTIGPMMPVKKADAKGLRTATIQLPPTGMPLTPAVARFGKYLAISTSTELIAQLARTGPTPPALLKDAPAFARFAKLEKLESNAFAYLSEQGSALIHAFQMQSIKGDIPPAMEPQIAKIYDLFTQKFAFSIGRLEKDGYVSTTYTSQGSKQIVAAVAVIPVAIVAAIAIPAAAQAKAKAAAAAAITPEPVPAQMPVIEEPVPTEEATPAPATE